MNKPNAKDFSTDNGMHSAMSEWAKSKQKKSVMVSVTYSDSDDVWSETFNRATKSVNYHTVDGEVYTQEVDCSKFANDFLPVQETNLKELKAMVTEFAQPKNGVTIVKMVWELV